MTSITKNKKLKTNTVPREKESYRVYPVIKYSGWTKKKIDSNYKECTLESLEELLEENNGYHMRINKKGNYVFFGDCDGYDKPFDVFQSSLINFLLSFFNQINLFSRLFLLKVIILS